MRCRSLRFRSLAKERRLSRKQALIQGATDLLVDVLDKPPAQTFVIIQEVALEDWGVGGVPVPEFRRRTAAETND
ncbi:MAG: 4-oxalocrotonate tautomerase family protein [Pirellulales bacterium]